METFMDENFLLNTTVAQELHHNHAAKCQLLIIIAISYLKWLQMIINFVQLLKSGWEATIINGERCVLMVSMKILHW